MTPELVAARVQANSANALILAWLGVDLRAPAVFWRDRTDQGWDEAGQVLFDGLGAGLLDEARLCVSIHNLLVRPENGLVFGASHGRYSFLLRTPGPQRALTLDGLVDIAPAGPQWSVVSPEDHDAESVAAISLRGLPRVPGDR